LLTRNQKRLNSSPRALPRPAPIPHLLPFPHLDIRRIPPKMSSSEDDVPLVKASSNGGTYPPHATPMPCSPPCLGCKYPSNSDIQLAMPETIFRPAALDPFRGRGHPIVAHQVIIS
jgi:hypothetical protein